MSSGPDLIPSTNGAKGNGTVKAKVNGKASPSETKTPFLIGVAGGTASGKVSNPKYFHVNHCATRMHLRS